MDDNKVEIKPVFLDELYYKGTKTTSAMAYAMQTSIWPSCDGLQYRLILVWNREVICIGDSSEHERERWCRNISVLRWGWLRGTPTRLPIGENFND